MEFTAATVGIPVRDLDAAVGWYRAALGLGEVDLAPGEGMVEFNVGPVWLQLALDLEHAGAEGISVTLSVADATAEHARFVERGLEVSGIQRYDGVVEFFTLTDPDGNKLGFVTELG